MGRLFSSGFVNKSQTCPDPLSSFPFLFFYPQPSPTHFLWLGRELSSATEAKIKVNFWAAYRFSPRLTKCTLWFLHHHMLHQTKLMRMWELTASRKQQSMFSPSLVTISIHLNWKQQSEGGFSCEKEQGYIFRLCKIDVISSRAISLTTSCHVE